MKYTEMIEGHYYQITTKAGTKYNFRFWRIKGRDPYILCFPNTQHRAYKQDTKFVPLRGEYVMAASSIKSVVELSENKHSYEIF